MAKFFVYGICGQRPRQNFVFAGYAAEGRWQILSLRDMKATAKFSLCRICGQQLQQNFVIVGYAAESRGKIFECLFSNVFKNKVSNYFKRP